MGDTTFMKQISLATTGFELVTKRTRKRVFLDELNLVVPWTELVGLIQPFASGKRPCTMSGCIASLRIWILAWVDCPMRAPS